MERPMYGYRKIHHALNARGYQHNLKKTQRLMRLTGLQAIAPKKKTMTSCPAHKKYPYLLNSLQIDNIDQVWAVDITYIKTRRGTGHLVGLIDIFSRKIVGWSFSPFSDTNLCIEALDMALKTGHKPKIINSDQGCQFTSQKWVSTLSSHEITISMDGKGRWVDNKYIERFWRSIKYEMMHLHDFYNIQEASTAIDEYIKFYNLERPHQSLKYKTPEVKYNELILPVVGSQIPAVFLS